MKKQTTYLLLILFFYLTFGQIIAQAKKVAYVQLTKTMDVTASTVSNDAITRMLDADPNFDLTVLTDDGNGSSAIVINDYDLIIVQETFGSAANILKPSGLLAIKNLTKPVIYNKLYALRNTRALSQNPDGVVATSLGKTITVDPANQGNALFTNIDFSGGSTITLFNNFSTDLGAPINDVKAIDVLNGLNFGVTNSLLATTSEVTDPTKAILVNDIPGGTQFGTNSADVLPASSRMIAFGFNYGAIAREDGANITPAMLTLWKNAAYILTGMEASLSIDKAGEVSNVSSNVKAIGNRIYVSNVKSATEVNIYSITGALVKSFKTNTDTDFNFKSGLWIATVKTFEGEKAVKLLTR